VLNFIVLIYIVGKVATTVCNVGVIDVFVLVIIVVVVVIVVVIVYAH
jgi:hypothetical protein